MSIEAEVPESVENSPEPQNPDVDTGAADISPIETESADRLNHRDEKHEITKGRKVARYMGSRYDWYNPQSRLARNDEKEGQKIERPNLDMAWSVFEHIALPRYLVGVKAEKGKGTFVRAEIGESEKKSALYPVWGTPQSDMADFGIGIGLYFSTLSFLAVIMLIAFAINVPSMNYFASTSYTPDAQKSLPMFLRGSPICTNVVFEPCPTCKKEDWDAYPAAFGRYAVATSNPDLHFIKKNHCEIGEINAIFSYASVSFVVVGIFVMMFYLRYRTVIFDQSEQTAQDYSIVVENPDPSAKDPEKWKQFFENMFDDVHVTVCTIVLNNENLINLLIKRRRLLTKIEDFLPLGESLDPLHVEPAVAKCPEKPLWKKIFFFASDAKGVYRSVQKLDKRIETLSNKTYSVSKVFITFETEKAQREVLKALSLPKRGNHSAMLEEKFKFNEKVLYVSEPDEPDAIRWFDLDDSPLKKIFTMILTNIITLALIAICGYAVYRARKVSPIATSLTITILSTVAPILIRAVNDQEKHPYESRAAASQYIKVTLFRWLITAIVISIITPFTDTLELGKGRLLPSLQAIFITEMIKRPIIQYLDIGGNIMRHVLGPRALDQRRMNVYFQGSIFEMEEKYTEITKIVFLTLFYGMIYPLAFLWAFISLVANYWVDKFSILRIWRLGQKLGKQVSVFSAQYFFPLCILTYSVLAAYSFSGFPYDNACLSNEETLPADYIGSYDISYAYDRETNKTESVNISADHLVYQFCDQHLIQPRKWPPQFPPLVKDGRAWMSDTQIRWLPVFSWTCIGTVIVLGAFILKKTLGAFIWSIFFSPYEPVGKPSDETFSQVDTIFGYIPQVRVLGYMFPLLMCDIDDIDLGLVGWSDPFHSYDRHNMIFDVPLMMELKKKQFLSRFPSGEEAGEEVNVEIKATLENPCFSIVKNWEPPNIVGSESKKFDEWESRRDTLY